MFIASIIIIHFGVKPRRGGTPFNDMRIISSILCLFNMRVVFLFNWLVVVNFSLLVISISINSIIMY